MSAEKYTVHQHSVGTILSWVDTGAIAIPEMQRPFVWNSTKVRDLIDSLYSGFPVGYLITWQNESVTLKDGSTSKARQIIIDGQQRITALTTALAGAPVVSKEYKRQRIKIAFDPLIERFETFTPVMRNNPAWIPDISTIMDPSVNIFSLVADYMTANPDADQTKVQQSIAKLLDIKTKQVGIIELASDLNIETVTEIFIRINSKGVVLNAADFAMSKIASYGDFGSDLRKFIDYFCHLSVAPHFWETIRDNDPAFASTEYFKHISWLRDDPDDLYDPTYRDVIRVVALTEFGRARIDALVSQLSGRDFETKKFDSARALDSFNRLERGITGMTNRYNFTQFTMIIRSAGYINSSMVTSYNAMNFAYGLFLRLRAEGELPAGEIQRIVRRWFVLSMLTGRAGGSFETQFEQDMRRIREVGAAQYLASIEASELSEGFWAEAMPMNLNTSSSRSPYFKAFLASQVKHQAHGFLSKHISVMNMLDGMGDIHHIFPKDYLAKHGVVDRSEINQIANYVLAETAINIRVSNKPPAEYMAMVHDQVATGDLTIGEIADLETLTANLRESAVPPSITTATIEDYPAFLVERRKLMANEIRRYYESL